MTANKIENSTKNIEKASNIDIPNINQFEEALHKDCEICGKSCVKKDMVEEAEQLICEDCYREILNKEYYMFLNELYKSGKINDLIEYIKKL